MDQTLRMGSDAQQHVLEVREGREVDQFTALHERIEEGGAARAFEAAAKSQFLRPSATTRSWFSARECRLPDYAAWVSRTAAVSGISDMCHSSGRHNHSASRKASKGSEAR
jgi:hypothetical protein